MLSRINCCSRLEAFIISRANVACCRMRLSVLRQWQTYISRVSMFLARPKLSSLFVAALALKRYDDTYFRSARIALVLVLNCLLHGLDGQCSCAASVRCSAFTCDYVD